MKFLTFATDVLPIPGIPTSGTALRTYGLIQGLRAHGHEVVAAVPQLALETLERAIDIASLTPAAKSEFDFYKRNTFDSYNQADLVREHNPDVILCGHWPAMCLRVKPSQALVVDLAGPHLLERHFQGTPEHAAAVLGKLGVIATADYFITSGVSQRNYFLSFMFRAAVEDPASRTVNIYMPLDPAQPEKIVSNGEIYPRFIFGGVYLPWQDPSWALGELVSCLDKKNSGSLQLIGGKHPNYAIRDGVYEELFRKLSLNSRVTTQPMLPYDQFVEELRRGDVAIDLMEWNLERQLAMTIRSTTYLSAGLPVIYNDYADLGSLIARYDAGWQVTPGDAQALSSVFDEIYSSPSSIAQKSKNALRLAAEEFAWDRAVLPLLNLLTAPRNIRVSEPDIILDVPQNTDLEVRRGKSVMQHFLCRMDGLSKVECKISPHRGHVSDAITLSLHRLGAPNESHGTLVAHEVLSTEELLNNDWARLEFSPIADSAGGEFLFEIDTKDETQESSLRVCAARTSMYPLGDLYHGGKILQRAALCLRTSCISSAIPEKRALRYAQ